MEVDMVNDYLFVSIFKSFFGDNNMDSYKDLQKVSSQFEKGLNLIILSVSKFKINPFWNNFRKILNYQTD